MIVLSIITPAFNSAKWLESCILNVAGQGVSDQIEHIVIDGGSKDESLDVLENYKKKLSHLRFLSEPDRGQSDAMNKGLQMAKGKWIGFLNADDFYEVGILKSVLEIINTNPEREAFLVGNLNILGENDSAISTCRPATMTMPYLLADICEWPYNPSAYFYPLRLHTKIGYFDPEEHYAMDYDFILRIMHFGVPVEYCNETWGNFRMQIYAKTVADQNAGLSYNRASKLRKMYFTKSNLRVRYATRFLIIFWAIRNKTLGIIRRLFEK